MACTRAICSPDGGGFTVVCEWSPEMIDHSKREQPRKTSQPNSLHTIEFEDPVERLKDATRKADEKARRIKRPGASGVRGGTSRD